MTFSLKKIFLTIDSGFKMNIFIIVAAIHYVEQENYINTFLNELLSYSLNMVFDQEIEIFLPINQLFFKNGNESYIFI